MGKYSLATAWPTFAAIKLPWLARACWQPAASEAHRAAQQRFVDARMPLHAAAAQRRLGELLSDERLIADADAVLFDHGAANPGRFAAMLAGISSRT